MFYKQKIRFASTLILIFVIFLSYRFILYNNAINTKYKIIDEELNRNRIYSKKKDSEIQDFKHNNRNLLDNSNKVLNNKVESSLNKDIPNTHLIKETTGRNVQEQQLDLSIRTSNQNSVTSLNLSSNNSLDKSNDVNNTSEQNINFLSMMERIVHLDLKGAPPKMEYLKKFFPLIKQHGATGILLEYEDTFPFTSLLAEAKYGYAYTREDVQVIKELAKQNGLFIIPLVQTYGHLEWLLKLEKFAHLREDSRYPQVITPCLNESYSVLYGK
jgi:hypothetical protein